jgi:hypothetical protein
MNSILTSLAGYVASTQPLTHNKWLEKDLSKTLQYMDNTDLRHWNILKTTALSRPANHDVYFNSVKTSVARCKDSFERKLLCDFTLIGRSEDYLQLQQARSPNIYLGKHD